MPGIDWVALAKQDEKQPPINTGVRFEARFGSYGCFNRTDTDPQVIPKEKLTWN